jgi:excisionase family DNA binding protein
MGKADGARDPGIPGLDSDLMTVKEVADYLRCHPESLYRLLRRNQIPAFKVGFDWRFSRRAIDAWIVAQNVTKGSGVQKH